MIRWAVVVTAFMAVLIVQWPVWKSLSQRWSNAGGYAHGYAVLLIALYLLYRCWPRLCIKSAVPSSLALVLLVPAALIAFVGDAAQVQILQFLVLPATLWLWSVAALGWRIGMALAVPAGIMYFATPQWDILTDPLRTITVMVTQGMLDLLQIPALVDGFHIHLPVGTFLVAGGCSGLNYLVIGLLVGTLQAYLASVEWWRRISMVAIAAILSLMSNWLRVIGLVLIGYRTEMQSGLIADHSAFGWWLFAGMLVVFFGVSLRLERGGRCRQELKPAMPSGQLPRSAAWFAAGAAIVVAVLPGWMLVSNGLVTAPVDRGSPGPHKAVLVEPAWLPAYKGYDIRQSWRLEDGGRWFELVVLTYLYQTQGKELIYFANRIADESHTLGSEVVTLSNGIQLNRERILTAMGMRMVWWYYSINNTVTSSAWQGKLLQLMAALKGDRGGSLVALSVKCLEADCRDEMVLSPSMEGLLTDWLKAG